VSDERWADVGRNLAARELDDRSDRLAVTASSVACAIDAGELDAADVQRLRQHLSDLRLLVEGTLAEAVEDVEPFDAETAYPALVGGDIRAAE
jgi:hypothetical protein